MSEQAFIYEVELKCNDCGKSKTKTMRLRPFEDHFIEKRIGCKECGDNVRGHTAMLMYFHRDLGNSDIDGNSHVRVTVRRVK